VNAIEFKLRVATLDDSSSLDELIELSVHGLMPAAYTPAQLQAALGTWLGLDTQLICDGTYFVVEAWTTDAAKPVLVGCGGWSKRKTPFGSDHRPGREDTLLDPARDAAKIRAFFVHPQWARRGIGRMLLEASEREARAAGFVRFEMGATLTGVPLYYRFGYSLGERIDLPLENGEVLPVVKMSKHC
jgi:GNAT superfamily N-acetyltransferase